MQAAGEVLSLAVQAIALVLFLSGAAEFAMLLKGCYVLRRLARVSSRDDTLVLLKSPMVPQISVVLAATDASKETRTLVRRLLDLHSAHHEVVLALRGVPQADLDQWKLEFRLFPTTRDVMARRVFEAQPPTRLLVLDLENATQPEALNAAARAAGGSIIGCLDADAELAPEALLRLLRPMLEAPEQIVACCGTAPPPFVPTLAGKFAAIDALRVWLVRCAAFTGWDMMIPVPGAGLLVSREALLEAGGFRPGPVELLLQLHGLARTAGKKYRVAFLPEPVSYLPAPGTLAELRSRIERDQREIAAAWRMRKTFAGGSGAIGRGLPALVAGRLWRPLLETIGYGLAIGGLATGLVPWQVVVLLLLCTVVTGMLVSMATVVLRELAEYRGATPAELTSLFYAAVLENLGYRQVRNLWLVGAFFRQGKAQKNRETASGSPGSAAASSKN